MRGWGLLGVGACVIGLLSLWDGLAAQCGKDRGRANLLAEHITAGRCRQCSAHVRAQGLHQAVAAHGPGQVVAAVQQAQHAHRQGIGHVARQHVHLLDGVMQGRALAPGLLHKADGLQQVLGHVRLGVDGAALGCQAQVGPLAGHGLEGFADGADVVVGGTEQRFHKVAVAVGLVHQRRLQAGDAGRRERAVGVHHAGHVLAMLLQLADEGAGKVPVRSTVQGAAVEHLQHAAVHQGRVRGGLLRGG